MKKGYFVISLDYELMWGVRDKKTVDGYGDAILGGKQQLSKTIELLKSYSCSTTVATVGLLFLRDLESIKSQLPELVPNYDDDELSPYPFIADGLGANETKDPFHYGYELTKMLHEATNVELATHTFSHYYCLEPGQELDAFRSDIERASAVALNEQCELKSIVFPRNQYSDDHLKICNELGIITYRGNPSHWIYEAAPGKDQGLGRRLLRLLDTYINITGHHCFEPTDKTPGLPLNIPGSRFLKPYSPLLRVLDGWKLARIKNSMTHAAKLGKVYHLWWHPHNFGLFPEENLNFLTKILKHYSELQKTYGFQSITMEGLSQKRHSK